MDRFIWSDFFKKNIFILNVVGLWPNTSDDKHKFGPYTVRFIFIQIFFAIAHGVFQIVIIKSAFSDSTSALMETIYVPSLGAFNLLKIYIFVRHNANVQHCLDRLNNNLFQPRNLEQKELLIQPKLKSLVSFYHFWMSLCAIGTFAWVVCPFLNGDYQDFGLPFPAAYPYDHKKPFLYPVTYVHQILGGTALVVSAINIDFLIWTTMACIGVQCDLLCNNLHNLQNANRDFKMKLKDCIDHHKMILKFFADWQGLFHILIFTQILTSSLSIGVIIYLLSSVVVGSFPFYKYLLTVSAQLMQNFPYCWFGNVVQSQSDKIAYAAFESAWIEQKPPEKRSLMIFTQMVQEPIKVSPFNLFDLSLETFVKIVKSAWSCYTITQQFSDSN